MWHQGAGTSRHSSIFSTNRMSGARQCCASNPPPVCPSQRYLTHTPTRFCCAGPSDAARKKSLLKRQRRAGTALVGRAAKLKRKAQVKERNIPLHMLDEFTAAIGLPGDILYVNKSHGKDEQEALEPLPRTLSMHVARGDAEAGVSLKRYHARICDDMPLTDK